MHAIMAERLVETGGRFLRCCSWISAFISPISLRWASIIWSASLRTRDATIATLAGENCNGVMRNHRFHVGNLPDGCWAANQPQSHNEDDHAAMIVTSTIIMFGLMYLNTLQIDHVFLSETPTCMAVCVDHGRFDGDHHPGVHAAHVQEPHRECGDLRRHGEEAEFTLWMLVAAICHLVS
jgi:hypothetical protein